MADSFRQEEEEQEQEILRSQCSQGHRSSLQLSTSEGGFICLICFCNLISTPTSPTVHIHYALLQISRAISDPRFLHNLRRFHAHLLVSPLTHLLSRCDDEPIARQAIDLVSRLCDSEDSSSSVALDVVARITDRLASESVTWSRRQIYSLHCLGVLLTREIDNLTAYIKSKRALISNLTDGLQLPSEEIRGEILFVLYRLSLLDGGNDNEVNEFLAHFPKILYISLETLLKTQSDEVRMNCIALLTVLAQREYFESLFTDSQTSRKFTEANNFLQAELPPDGTSMILLFAEAIKGPLLSSDTQVQIGTLDLIYHCLSWQGTGTKHIELLIEQNIADYVIEILRFSGNKDNVVNSCLKVLSLLSVAEQAFSHRLAIGFSTLVPVLRYVAEVPFHPVQTHILKLTLICITNCPGIISRSQAEELVFLLTGMFRKHTSGEMGMHPEAFIMSCSIFVAVLKSPSSEGISTLSPSLQEALRDAVIPCLCIPTKHSNELLYSLYFLKEAHAYNYKERTNTDSNDMALVNCIIEICENHLLPWLKTVLGEIEDETMILGVLETFHSIMLQGTNVQARQLTEVLVSSSWFTLSFGFLGLFPTEKMKWRVYLMLSSIIDGILGDGSGQPIRDAALYLPSDPIDLLFLLGQKSSFDWNLISCQSAVLLILHTSSLYDERIAEEKQVLASLEQYILVNSSNFSSGIVDSATLMQVIHLYGLFRSFTKMTYQIPYSTEAENLLFCLANEKEWDILCARSHPVSVKWLLEQEKIIEPLSYQILNLCRLNSRNGVHIIVHGHNNCTANVLTIAEVVAAGDNFGAPLLVSLLKQLQEEGQEEDITSVVNLMTVIINIFPAAANQLCLHGICNAIQSLYHYSSHYSSSQVFMNCSVLIFNILHSAKPETVFEQEAWLSLSLKLLEVSIQKLATDACDREGLLTIGILSLILHHSTNKTLAEASKSILLNPSLASAISNLIRAACSKGPALADHDEETSTGEILIFVLSMYYFSLKSQHALLPETLDWQHFLEQYGQAPLSIICIPCHDLCRLIYFGPPKVKLVASYCLLEMLTIISEQRQRKLSKQKCSLSYLKSVITVLEGLVFDSDIKVATNSALCLSTIMGWEKLSMQEASVIRDTKWCRQVVEELALSLVAPGLISRSFTNQHKAATHIAVALLRLDQVPGWMKFAFDDSCISHIIENISANNVSAELAQLFRELLRSDYLRAEHIAALNHVFQACRTQVYTSSLPEGNENECHEKVIMMPDDLEKVRRILICLISSHSSRIMASGKAQTGNRRLLEEIEMFFQESSKHTIMEKQTS